MGIKSALGLESEKKVRYGIVALGDISQESLMPGVSHTGNSTITALVSSDSEKARKVARQYSIPDDAVYGYEQFGALLTSGKVDALYVATPNWRHAEFAVPALKAGVHVLLEKPMEVSVAKCQQILDAQRSSDAKLMVAYRLHFEPATLAILDLTREGKIGEMLSFSSTFAMKLKPENHRAHHGVEAGPIFDLGPYPINAVRNLFQKEPTEVFAMGAKHAGTQLGDFEDTVTVMLRFPDDRLAHFVVSYVGDSIDAYTVLGSEGSLLVNPAYSFGKPLTYTLRVDKKESTESFKSTDHFGGELQYFSDCVLHGKHPEPDGEEGLLDVRVIEAIVQSLKTRQAVSLAPMVRSRRIDTDDVKKLSPVSAPKLVKTDNPSQ